MPKKINSPVDNNAGVHRMIPLIEIRPDPKNVRR